MGQLRVQSRSHIALLGSRPYRVERQHLGLPPPLLKRRPFFEEVQGGLPLNRGGQVRSQPQVALRLSQYQELMPPLSSR